MCAEHEYPGWGEPCGEQPEVLKPLVAAEVRQQRATPDEIIRPGQRGPVAAIQVGRHAGRIKLRDAKIYPCDLRVADRDPRRRICRAQPARHATMAARQIEDRFDVCIAQYAGGLHQGQRLASDLEILRDVAPQRIVGWGKGEVGGRAGCGRRPGDRHWLMGDDGGAGRDGLVICPKCARRVKTRCRSPLSSSAKSLSRTGAG